MNTIKYTTKINSTDFEVKTVPCDKYAELCNTFGCYEVLPDDTNIKLYLDIDFKQTEDEPVYYDTWFDSLLEISINAITKFCVEEFDQPNPRFTICQSNSASFIDWKTKKNMWKVSIHIIVENVIATKKTQLLIVNALNAYCKDFTDYQDWMGDQNLFDKSIYDLKRKLRSIGCSKPDENRPLILHSGSFEGHCVSAFIPDDAIVYYKEIEQKCEYVGCIVESSIGSDDDYQKFAAYIDAGLLIETCNEGSNADYTKVGYALLNILGVDKAKVLFQKLTMDWGSQNKRDEFDKFFDYLCIRKDRNLKVGRKTIIEYAKKVNIEKVKEINKQFIKSTNHITNWDLSEAEFAKALKRLIFNNKPILYTGKGKEPEGYMYNGYLWENLALHNAELEQDSFDKLYQIYISEVLCYKDIWDEDQYKSTLASIKSLNAHSKRSNIIKIFKSDNYVADVKWNENPYLIAFNNCIFDLRIGEKVPPVKEDYINMTTGYDYDDNYPLERIGELENIVKSILPFEDIRILFLVKTATGLSGIQLQQFFINTGKGGNGKSLLRDLTGAMVGSGHKNYGYKLPSSVIQTSLTSKGASPELANLHQKRMIWFSEPNQKFKLCTAVLKEITGEGEINARALYSGNTKVELSNTTDLDCNDIPFLDSIDGGVGRRIIGIPFETTAYDKSVYDLLEDKTLSTVKRLEYSTGIWRRKYRQAYFMMLLPYFKIYMDGYSFAFENLPEKFKKLTEKHMSASDDILSFIHNYYERDCDATEPIKLKDIYKKFKYSETFANLNKKEQRTNTEAYFVDKIETNFSLKRYVKKRDERYNGIRLKSSSLVGYKLRVEDNDTEEP
jgi:hypothetical protein